MQSSYIGDGLAVRLDDMSSEENCAKQFKDARQHYRLPAHGRQRTCKHVGQLVSWSQT